MSTDDKVLEQSAKVLAGTTRRRNPARVLPFLGPAFVASVAYIDPGNFATNIQGGAEFGYTLLWVVVASNAMAMLIQALSAKLGIATGRNLAELCRVRFARPTVLFLWVLMEVVAMATDLAEFVGAAVGFNLLLHVPLWAGGVLTGIATLAILGLDRYGFRPLEAVIASLVGVVSVSYLIETVLDRPDWKQAAFDAVVPQFAGPSSVLLAAGILGATVMPHVIFLHSALTQGRIVTRDPPQMKRLLRYEIVDVTLAMGLAGAINAAMLVMAAAAFHGHEAAAVGTLADAHRTLEPLLGRTASSIFALALVASGLASSAVGTMSGQVVMQGFVEREIPVWIRRVVTMAPSFVVILLGLDPTRTLVLSQVVLSFGLPFAIVPLVLFTRRRDLMGVLVNRWYTTVAIAIVAAAIIALNVFLLVQTFFGA